MQLPGLQALGLTPQSFQFAGLNGNNSAQPSGLSPQGSQALGGPSAGLQALGGLPPASPSFMGSGQSNFAGFDSTNAFSTIGASPLTPTYRPDLNALTGVGNKLNFSC
jgi:hypothetical protein